TRSDEVIEPGGPSPGGTSSPCHNTRRAPSQTTTSCQTPLTSLTKRSRVNPRTDAPPRTPESASSAISGSRREALAAESRSWYGCQPGKTAGISLPKPGRVTEVPSGCSSIAGRGAAALCVRLGALAGLAPPGRGRDTGRQSATAHQKRSVGDH